MEQASKVGKKLRARNGYNRVVQNIETNYTNYIRYHTKKKSKSRRENVKHTVKAVMINLLTFRKLFQ